MQKINEDKGITLIALIVTIIVLIILAGVSISASLKEDNGIVNQSKEAKLQSEMSEEIDVLELSTLGAMKRNADYEVQKDNLIKELDINVGSEKYEITGQDGVGFEVTFKDSNRKYRVDIDGEVTPL